jgi:hypothetical protein
MLEAELPIEVAEPGAPVVMTPSTALYSTSVPTSYSSTPVQGAGVGVIPRWGDDYYFGNGDDDWGVETLFNSFLPRFDDDNDESQRHAHPALVAHSHAVAHDHHGLITHAHDGGRGMARGVLEGFEDNGNADPTKTQPGSTPAPAMTNQDSHDTTTERARERITVRFNEPRIGDVEKPCPRGYVLSGDKCYENCPPQYRDDGEYCERDSYTIDRDSYDRGAGVPYITRRQKYDYLFHT